MQIEILTYPCKNCLRNLSGACVGDWLWTQEEYNSYKATLEIPFANYCQFGCYLDMPFPGVVESYTIDSTLWYGRAEFTPYKARQARRLV